MNLKVIIDKLSSYNLYNYLFPGFIFIVTLDATTGFISSFEYSVEIVIIIYFIGLVISRIGSLVVETVLTKIKDIGAIDTKDLFSALKESAKLEAIFEAMNMFRTIAAGSLLLFFATLVDILVNRPKTGVSLLYLLVELLIFILFLFAFIKMRQKVIECLK